MIQPWPQIASRTVFDTGLFSVTRDRTRSPRTGLERDVYVVHMVDWLMTVPLTAGGELVLVRQYRHGSRQASLEIPGGLHDSAGERPEEGAARELAEETGYGGGEFSFLGELRPQPALMSNRLRIYLAQGVRRTAAPQPDAGEDIEVVLLDPREVPARIASGEINNAMTVTALALARFGGHL
ncbi:MAG: NUDIX hydrolase [Betaproteobacteria bacterium]|nr:MAG: NUDIX hydrolase [Betaproteobacteria bacterium]